MNKKGIEAIALIGSIIVMIIILLILVYLITGTINPFAKKLVSCPGVCITEGVCRDYSTIGNTRYDYGNCVTPDGKDGICCASIKDITKGRNASDVSGGSGTSTNTTQGLALEIRKDNSIIPISHTSTQLLFNAKSTVFHFFGTGLEGATCSMEIQPDDQKPLGQRITQNKEMRKVPCAGENNKASVTLTARYTENGGETPNPNQFKMYVYLYDKNGVQSQSAILNIWVRPEEEIEPIGLQGECPYTFCVDITNQAECKDPVDNCPSLSCEWAPANGRCVFKLG